MSVCGGKKIKVGKPTAIELTANEYESILQDITTVDNTKYYNDLRINRIIELYTESLNKRILIKDDSDNITFLINELVFQFMIPVYVGQSIDMVEKETEVIQKYVNIQKMKQQKLNFKGVGRHARDIATQDKPNKSQIDTKYKPLSTQLNYPTDVIIYNHIRTNIQRLASGMALQYNGILMPSHNVSKKSSSTNRKYPIHNIKDIFISGYYNNNEPTRDEYTSFITSHIHLLNDNATIFPTIYPYYGRETIGLDRVIIGDNIYSTIKLIIYYIRNVIHITSRYTPIIYNNILFRYIPDRLDAIVGKGEITSPKSIIISPVPEKLFIKIKNLLKIQFNADIDLYVFLDIIKRYELENLYYNLLYDVSHNETSQLLDSTQNIIKNKNQLHQQNLDLIHQQLQNLMFRQASLYTLSIDPDITPLSSQQTQIVEMELERRSKKLKQVSTNTCPHIKLVNQLSNGHQIRSNIQTIQQLEKYMIIPKEYKEATPGSNLIIEPPGSGKKSVGLIQCGNCRMDTICPHLYHQLKMELDLHQSNDRKSNTILSDIKNFLVRTYAITNNQDTQMGMIYCKICGGKIQEDNKVLDVMAETNLMGEYIYVEDDEVEVEINKLVYIYSSHIIKNHVQFKTIIEPKMLIRIISKMVYPDLKNIQTKLSIKSRKEDTIVDPKLHPYTIINVIMAIIVIALTGSDIDIVISKVKSSSKDGGNSKPGKVEQAKNMFNIATKILLTAYKTTFDRHEIPQEHMKKLMIVAFKKLSGEAVDTPNLVSKTELQSLISVSPIYEYLYRNRLLYDIKITREDVNTIVGLTPQQIISGNYKRNTFSSEVLPQPKKDLHSHNQFKSDVIKNLLTEYIDKEVFTYPQDHIIKDEYYNQHQSLLNREQELVNKLGTIRDRHLNHRTLYAPRNNPRRYRYSQTQTKLNKQFTLDGKTRKWNTYVYRSGKYILGDPSLIGKSQNELVDMISEDGFKMSSVNSRDNSKIKKALADRDTKDNFYIYYQFRCPQGGTHHFKGGEICSKCKGSHHQLQEQTKDYFQKYKATYLASRSKTKIKTSSTIKETKYKKKSITNAHTKFQNTSYIIQASKQLSVPHNILLNLGLIHQYNYKDVFDHKINPITQLDSDSDDKLYYVFNHNKFSIRLQKITLYVNNMLRYYQILLDYDTDIMYPTQKEVFIKYSRVVSQRGTEYLHKNLPSIYSQYVQFQEQDTNLSIELQGSKQLYFLLYTLVELHSFKHKDKDICAIGKSFAEWYIKHILHNEMLLSKFNEDELRRDRSERYNQVKEEMSRLQDSNMNNESLEIIQMYDPDFVKKHGLQGEVEDAMGDNNFEMTVDVDEDDDLEREVE